MDTTFENITPWNGANDSGLDVRKKWERNFDKVKQNFAEIVDDYVDSEDLANILKDALDDYLNRDKDEIINALYTFKKGIVANDLSKFLKGINIGDSFVSGSYGGFLGVDSNGKIYLEVDKILVRIKAYFESLEIKKVSYIAGEEIISPAGGITCTNVEELADVYRCHFMADDGDIKVNNYFAVDDLAISKDFNVKSGVYENVSNNYYWRRVVTIGDDYIDLSKTDCDANSGTPVKGDKICHLGNKTNADRQAAILLSATNNYAPCITLYAGIDSYSLTNKEYIQYGFDKNTGKAFHNVYGNAYIGDKNKTNYIQLKDDLLEVCAKFISKSTGIDLETSIANLSDSLNNVKSQTDKQFIIWFGTITPTLMNEPAMEWTTNDIKDMHIDDWYFIKTESVAGGLAYRFEKDTSGNYVWNSITDADTIAALTKASEAKNSADSAQSDATSALTAISNIVNDNILSASEKPSQRQAWNVVFAEKTLNDASADTYGISRIDYDTAFQNLSNYLNNNVIWTSGIPLWLSDDNLNVNTSIVGDTYRSTWQNYYTSRTTLLNAITAKAKTLADSAQNTAIKKARVFVDTPVPPYSIGDLWVNVNYTDGSNILYTNDLLKCKVAKNTGDSFNISDWEPANAATTAYIKNMGDTVKIEILGKDAQGNLNTVLTSINADSSGVKIHADKLGIDATVLANLIMATGLQVGVKDAQGNFTAINFSVATDGSVIAKNITAEGIIKANLLYTSFNRIDMGAGGIHNWNPSIDGNFIQLFYSSQEKISSNIINMPTASAWNGAHLYAKIGDPITDVIRSTDGFKFINGKTPINNTSDGVNAIYPGIGIYEFISDGTNWYVMNYSTNIGPLVHTGIKDDSSLALHLSDTITYASFYNSADKIVYLPSNPIPFREITLYRGGNGNVTIIDPDHQILCAGVLQNSTVMAHKSERGTVVYNGVNWDYSYGNYN